ncbi:MAG: hypothetical protein V1648_02035 [Candidatus Aenigmatarchaeota archaeon]
MDKQKISGYVMVIAGFAMLVLNAVSYIFGLDTKNPAFSVLGLIFVFMGLKTSRKTSNSPHVKT